MFFKLRDTLIYLITFLLIVSSHSSFAATEKPKGLDEKFLRNGECYMLIGETQVLRGIYRLNNPVKDKVQLNQLVIAGSRFNNSFGFAADLDRNLYTFTETKDNDFHLKSGNIYRQVLTGVAQYLTDYGYYTWHHHDSRNYAELNKHVYRRVDGGASWREPGKHYHSVGNCHGGCPNVRNFGRCSWLALNPGSPVTPPKGYKLPGIKADQPWSKQYCPEVAGVAWYAIPNGQWYASWRHSDGNGYLNYVDYDYILEHHYMKWTWKNSIKESDEVNYSSAAQGNEVAASAETKTTRNSVNGCLDSCGADTSLGSAPAKEMTVDIAMQPPMLGGGGDRVYSLARDVDAELYDLKIAEGNAAAKEYKKGWIRGTPNVANSKWIGISLKNANQDFVYIMGANTIKQWYKLCWPDVSDSLINNMKIECVGVSNRWDQKGGIVYAYDSHYKNIYKFACVDSGGSEEQLNPGLPTEGCFESISVVKSIDAMGGDGEKAQLDDIKADGFGSVFFGLSFPSPKTSLNNLRSFFKPEYAVHICKTGENESKEPRINIILKMEYAKVVFERNINGGAIREIGRRPFAWDYYSIQKEIKPECYNELCSLTWPNKTWVNVIRKYHPEVNSDNWKDLIVSTNGNCDHNGDYKNLDLTDPGHCKLAVINVPTPDKVIALSGYNSYLDIIGPYSSYTSFVQNDDSSITTNQSANLLTDGKALELNTLYYYMVENYPLTIAGINPKEQPDWDDDGRHGGFITTIVDRYPYRPEPTPEKPLSPGEEPHLSGVKYEWKTWMVMDLYGNCCCELIQETKPEEANPYNFVYSPVFGKFIMTCKVQYKWYNYDNVPFGGNIDDMMLGKYDGVIKSWTWAFPLQSNRGAYNHQTGRSRLEEIMNSFSFNDWKFMLDPKDQEGNSLKGKVDYYKIINEDEDGGEFLAMEPISVGNATDTPPETVYQIAEIERCDDIPDYPLDKYIYDNNYWASAPVDTKCFGIKAGEVYNWRICLASQTNMMDFTYLRNEMKNNEKSPFFVNQKIKDFEFKGAEDGSDLRWVNNKILVSASLVYEVPAEGGGTKETFVALKQARDSSSSEVGSDYEFEYEVDENPKNPKNLVYYTTSGDLPPTDPTKAKIRIKMRRQYAYDMQVKRDDLPIFSVRNLPGWLHITGEADIIILDAVEPKIVWDKTSHNNLFGITNRPITVGEGPGKGNSNSKNVNPDYVEFVVNDNNPWEAVESPAGISLSKHIENYAYNYGADECAIYCQGNPKFEALKVGYGLNVKSEIEKAKASKAPSAKFNYRPLFSKAAREVRIMFETSKRNTSGSANKVGKVEVNRADKLYDTINTRNFNNNDSNYVFHYHNDNNGATKYEKYLIWDKEKSRFFDMIGNTPVYTATNYYKFSVPNLEIGTKDNGFDVSPRYSSTNIVPDGYANNTPGYRPYKFYVSVSDSSGNYIKEKELNVALHVKDDIPPIGYGSIFDYKDEILTYFPCKDLEHLDVATNTPYYTLDKENYFGSTLNEQLVRKDWIPSATNVEGFINDASTGPGITYKALKSFGDKVTTGIKDEVFIKQIKNGVPPRYMNDNVECEFKTFVSDNCGIATAALSVSYFTTADGGGEKTDTVYSTWTSAAKVDSFENDLASSSEDIIHTIFRGKTEHFLMGIPIKIESVDNARDWDYYNTPAGSAGSDGIWKWGTLSIGKDSPNKRVFKTTLPVYNSVLDIRILDKTIKNQY